MHKDIFTVFLSLCSFSLNADSEYSIRDFRHVEAGSFSFDSFYVHIFIDSSHCREGDDFFY